MTSMAETKHGAASNPKMYHPFFILDEYPELPKYFRRADVPSDILDPLKEQLPIEIRENIFVCNYELTRESRKYGTKKFFEELTRVIKETSSKKKLQHIIVTRSPFDLIRLDKNVTQDVQNLLDLIISFPNLGIYFLNENFSKFHFLSCNDETMTTKSVYNRHFKYQKELLETLVNPPPLESVTTIKKVKI